MNVSYRESNKVMLLICGTVPNSTYFGGGGGGAGWESRCHAHSAPQVLSYTNVGSAFIWNRTHETSSRSLGKKTSRHPPLLVFGLVPLCPQQHASWYRCPLLQDTRGWLHASTQGMGREHCTAYPVPRYIPVSETCSNADVLWDKAWISPMGKGDQTFAGLVDSWWLSFFI